MSVPRPLIVIGVVMTGSADGPLPLLPCAVVMAEILREARILMLPGPEWRAAPVGAGIGTDWWIRISPWRSLPNDVGDRTTLPIDG